MSKENQILPVLNTEVLQEKATEFAMKGAIESIKEFYSGYNSPFRKQIEEQLNKTKKQLLTLYTFLFKHKNEKNKKAC
jgi:hypothetical protein